MVVGRTRDQNRRLGKRCRSAETSKEKGRGLVLRGDSCRRESSQEGSG